MEYKFYDDHCAKLPKIFVTKLEYQWLNNERVRALREAPVTAIPVRHMPGGIYRGPKAKLIVKRRSKDGCLIASILVTIEGSKTRYVRNLRVPSTLGSTSDRELSLRRISK
jgi:hypothetical protein